MSKRGWSAWTVLVSRSRSIGASNRSVGAVITSTGAFGFASEDAHGLVRPESLDQPLGERSRFDRELAGALDRQLVHERFGVGLGSRAACTLSRVASVADQLSCK
jgi:hypothetical protein